MYKRQVRENLKLTGLSQQAQVVQRDSISFLMSCREKFDVIFLDPPYLTGALEKAVETVSAFDILREHGIMVCESPLEQELPALAAPYERGKEYRYGKIKPVSYTHLDVYKRQMYTYEMMNEIEALSQGVITFNTLYLTIHRLQDFGYVEEQGKVVSEDNRVRLYFAITPKGEGYLAALIREYRQYTDTVDQILGLPERGKEV